MNSRQRRYNRRNIIDKLDRRAHIEVAMLKGVSRELHGKWFHARGEAVELRRALIAARKENIKLSFVGLFIALLFLYSIFRR